MFAMSNGHHEHEWLGYRKGRFSEHKTAAQTRNLCDPTIWNSYRKIAFVRHPYTWVRSIYHEKLFNSMMHENRTKPYPEYIRNLHTNMFRWFVDEDDRVLIDTIYRMEDLDKIMMEEFGAIIGHKNRTPNNASNTLTEENKAILNEKFAREMEFYPSTSSTV
jgi:hypothetical protein